MELNTECDILKVVLDDLSDGLVVFNLTNQVVYANPEAARVFGAENANSLILTPAEELLHYMKILSIDGRLIEFRDVTELLSWAEAAADQSKLLCVCSIKAGTEMWSLVKAKSIGTSQK